MIFVGMAIILFSVVVRGFLFPTEYSLGDDKDESRRVFFNPIIVFVYWLIERGCRWGGATLIVFDIVGFNGSLMTILLGGMFTGGDSHGYCSNAVDVACVKNTSLF
ncbi:hypothetical protein I5485_21880 [Citrobacter farmeri]|uniref:hypothetical protein n=1 Tax=Citrobacter farmeri TaxID=67824 RepID=UPI001902F1A5|nr:hypothetical protein [Citrobacter farmeri]MBJ9165094.1 hypothetical protein [Citrobacter farmeri]